MPSALSIPLCSAPHSSALLDSSTLLYCVYRLALHLKTSDRRKTETSGLKTPKAALRKYSPAHAGTLICFPNFTSSPIPPCRSFPNVSYHLSPLCARAGAKRSWRLFRTRNYWLIVSLPQSLSNHLLTCSCSSRHIIADFSSKTAADDVQSVLK